MTELLGKDHHTYKPLPDWANLPSELDLGGVAGIARLMSIRNVRFGTLVSEPWSVNNLANLRPGYIVAKVPI